MSPAVQSRRKSGAGPTRFLAAFVPPAPRSDRARTIARWFGLRFDAPAPTVQSLPDDLLPAPGQIVLLGGASGSGKSTLLRQIAGRLESRGVAVIDLARLPLPDLPVCDCLPDLSLEAALMLLGRMGLGEAWTYLRTPGELSDGQRWRLRLAIALHHATREPSQPAVLICDEFTALLDRLTAGIVSHSLRKLINTHPQLGAVLATCHEDITQALCPNRIIHCDFGQFTTLSTEK